MVLSYEIAWYHKRTSKAIRSRSMFAVLVINGNNDFNPYAPPTQAAFSL